MDPFVSVTSLRVAVSSRETMEMREPFFSAGVEGGTATRWSLASQVSTSFPGFSPTHPTERSMGRVEDNPGNEVGHVCEDSLWPKIPELSENLTKSISQGETGRNIPTISYPDLPHLRGIRLKTG